MIQSLEDRVFFCVTGFIGLFTKGADIINNHLSAGFIPGLFEALIDAGLIAFISGFLGLLGKKCFELIWNKYFKKR